MKSVEVEDIDGTYICPKCNCIQESYCTEYDDKDHYPKYCYNCGQH